MVVPGLLNNGGRGQIGFAARCDMSELGCAAETAAHASQILNSNGMPRTILVGYGAGQQVTPNMDVFRGTMAQSGIEIHEAARVDEGRWFSYLCIDPSCHPVEAVALDADTLDAADRARMGSAAATRQALADSIAPLAGEQADAPREVAARVAAEPLPRDDEAARQTAAGRP